ncbi:MAG: ndoA [Anaerocolumna sp.]|jgi:mRNA interferase MazF|nr:ndoA [Anaerocolumna sp.]
MIIKRGDIFYIDIKNDELDPHKQIGCRPCIIISNDMNNKHNSRVQYIPLTSRDKKYIPTHVILKTTEGLQKESIALCECIDGISKAYIKEKIGHVSEEDMIKIENAMDIQLNPSRTVRFVVRNPRQYAHA